ncbi:hypothetical protein [Brevibacillus agri]|uniref:hypothetical protein n=1 Tax=Brevibacillus agri TaxID=51101 RepID=UPI003D221B71
MNHELFQPTLKPNVDYETKSYNLTHYLLAVFLGGLLPAIVLGIKNAGWLRIKPLWSYVIAAAGVAVFFFAARYAHFFAIGTAIMYYFLMRGKYRIHMRLYAKTEPILPEAVLYALLGKAVEWFFAAKGVQLFHGN